MTTRPASELATGAVSGGGSSAVAVRDWLHQLNDFIGQMPGGAGIDTKVISGGAIVPTFASVYVDTEGGAAADDLDTIVGDLAAWPLGSLLSINSVDATRVVTVKHRTSGSGHIMLRDSADLVLGQQSVRLELQRVSSDRWIERQRWYGSQIAAFRSYLGLGNGATQALASQSEAQAGTASTLMTPARVKDALDYGALVIGSKTEIFMADLAPGQMLLLQLADNGQLRRVSLDELRKQFNKPHYTSGQLAISTPETVATHAQGVDPSDVKAILVCIEDDIGFSATVNGGARLFLNTEDTTDNSRSVTIGYDNQQVWALLPSGFRVKRRDTGALAAITFSRWRIVFKVWI